MRREHVNIDYLLAVINQRRPILLHGDTQLCIANDDARIEFILAQLILQFFSIASYPFVMQLSNFLRKKAVNN